MTDEGWIRVEDALPEPRRIVLAYGCHPATELLGRTSLRKFVGFFNGPFKGPAHLAANAGWTRADDIGGVGESMLVTHWMPLPKAPPDAEGFVTWKHGMEWLPSPDGRLTIQVNPVLTAYWAEKYPEGVPV